VLLDVVLQNKGDAEIRKLQGIEDRAGMGEQ
jgi:hypothetical protein